MRILLAFSPYRHEMIYPDTMGKRTVFAKKDFSRIGGVTPPLGLLTLASVLLRAKHEVRILMGFFETEESFLVKAKEFHPDVIGFHTAYFSWPLVCNFVPKIKAVLPTAKFMIGGPYASFSGSEPLEQCACIDASLQGESDEIILPVCEALASNSDLSDIPGVLWRKNGELVCNSGPVVVEDLDQTEYPAYQLVDVRKFSPSIGSFNKLPSVNLMTSRGCEKQCKFCISLDNVRWRSVEHTMGEIRRNASEFGVKHLLFFDENFTADEERAIEIADRIRCEKIPISFAINSRVDTVSLKMFKALKAAGCWRVLYGIESGVQKNLDFIKKDQTLEQARHAVKVAKQAKLQVRTMFILGLPGETFEEGIQTIDFAISLKPHMASFSNFTPLPGAPIWDDIHDLGTLSNAGALHLINFIPFTMSQEELMELNRQAFRRFYMRPSFILSRLLSIRSTTDLLRYIRGFLGFFHLKGSRTGKAEVQPATQPKSPDAGPPRLD